MTLDYDKIKVSTKTIIGSSNIQVDIQKVYDNFPLDIKNEQNIIIKAIYYNGERRGFGFEDKKKKKKSFRNAINLIAHFEDKKKINFKVSKNGKFQLTGCKSEDHAIRVVRFFIEQLKEHCASCIILPKSNIIRVFFQTVMTNIDFSIGFFINRQKLDELMNKDTQYHSLLETSCGYTGVNIKFPLLTPWWDLPVPVITCLDCRQDVLEWSLDSTPLSDIFEVPQDKKSKKKYNTFLVFHSGNIIMSGMIRDTMKKDFDVFVNTLRSWRHIIEEKIVEN